MGEKCQKKKMKDQKEMIQKNPKKLQIQKNCKSKKIENPKKL